MSDQAATLNVICAHCLSAMDGDANLCPVCGAAALKEVPSLARRQPPQAAPMALRYTLSTFMLWMALVAALLALAKPSIGAAVAAGFVSIPAMIRTMIVVNRYNVRTGRSPDIYQKLVAFVSACGVVVAFCGGGLVPTLGVIWLCTSVFRISQQDQIGNILMALVATVVGGFAAVKIAGVFWK